MPYKSVTEHSNFLRVEVLAQLQQGHSKQDIFASLQEEYADKDSLARLIQDVPNDEEHARILVWKKRLAVLHSAWLALACIVIWQLYFEKHTWPERSMKPLIGTCFYVAMYILDLVMLFHKRSRTMARPTSLAFLIFCFTVASDWPTINTAVYAAIALVLAASEVYFLYMFQRKLCKPPRKQEDGSYEFEGIAV
ncbi:MAG: hypothetical protein RL660_3149 [Bacteroidota bacterium]|jgi:membrane protein implicated in regulation of membrane protease activity